MNRSYIFCPPSICEIKKTTPDLIEINSQLLWGNVCGAIGSINQFVLVEKTDLLRDHASLNTSTGSRDYTPYPSPYERGNFFHRGSPEEELIDSNDGLMKSWARAGKKYLNDDGLLPSGNYTEYDVNGNTKPNKRDGESFARNDETGEVYYTNNHYENFIKITK